MAGGIWTNQNKVRPGAYINFESNPATAIVPSDRGIVTMAVELDWGKENELIEVSAEDYVTGKALASIGLMPGDAEAKLLNLALQNASILKLYRLNSGGAQAGVTINENLVVTAKYNGTFGNKIAILITNSDTDGIYNVQTYANGYLVDTQKASTIDQLVANDFVTFSGTGNLSTVAATLLTGGTNGDVTESTSYTAYLNVLKTNKWNTMAVLTDNITIITQIIQFIRVMREEEGKYVQAVVANNNSVDYEGIINNINGVVIDGENITAVEFTAWVAGATAGADITESLTGKIVENATSIINMKSNSEIIAGLQRGEFLLSLNQDGSVKVEKDINSLHTFNEKLYSFSKNRIIRELDSIGSSIEDIWERTYLGKVVNNVNGRNLFKASIINYLTDLQNRGAIDEFDRDQVVVEEGIDIDSVVASLAIKPLDSMEFLYMTINID